MSDYNEFIEWFKNKYNFDPSKGYGITASNYTTFRDRNGNSFYTIFQEDKAIIAEGGTPPEVLTPDVNTELSSEVSKEDALAFYDWLKRKYGAWSVEPARIYNSLFGGKTPTYQDIMSNESFGQWYAEGKPTPADTKAQEAEGAADYVKFSEWFKATYGADPASAGFNKNNYKTVRNSKGELFYDLYTSATPEEPPTETPTTTGLIPKGYTVVIPNVLLKGPDGKYYDYATALETGWQSWVEVDADSAALLIKAWQAESSGSPSTTTYAGVPEKQQSADGTWWWVYKDEKGNIISVQQVTDENKDMTEYEKAQYDLSLKQFEWNKQQTEMQKAEAEAQKFTSPRDWIQRWGVQNPGTLPNAPSWLNEYTGLNPNQPISAAQPKLASGQSLTRLNPSELEGMYGYADWAAGRGSPYASGEDWAYQSQKLLPTNAPRRTYSWNPNVRS
jgi:hypothetical protein